MPVHRMPVQRATSCGWPFDRGVRPGRKNWPQDAQKTQKEDGGILCVLCIFVAKCQFTECQFNAQPPVAGRSTEELDRAEGIGHKTHKKHKSKKVEFCAFCAFWWLNASSTRNRLWRAVRQSSSTGPDELATRRTKNTKGRRWNFVRFRGSMPVHRASACGCVSVEQLSSTVRTAGCRRGHGHSDAATRRWRNTRSGGGSGST